MITKGTAYKITNKVTDAAYIGITLKTAEERFKGHWKAAKREDSVLYRALRKYGREAFSVEIVGAADSPRELFALERHLIQVHRTHVRCGGYNMTAGGEGTPDICDLTRERMRAAARRRAADPIYRQKISTTLMGRKAAPEAIAKGAATRTGKPLSDAHRQKLSEVFKGRKISPEQREQIAASLRGRKLPPEHIEATRRGLLGKRHSPERRARLSAVRSTPESRIKTSEASKRMWAKRRAEGNQCQLQLL